MTGYDAWKLCSPDDDRRETRTDKEAELLDWYAKHLKKIDDECALRQAELDDWYVQAVADLDAEYVAEKDSWDDHLPFL